MFILSTVACIISNLRELKIPFSVKWRQRQKKRDRQRHWGWKQNCVLTWRRSGWTMPVLWASAMGSNPRAFPIGPSARRPVSRLGPGERRRPEDGHRAFLSQPHPAASTRQLWPSHEPLHSRVVFVHWQACWEISAPDRLWLACLVTPPSQWGIHWDHRHFLMLWMS